MKQIGFFLLFVLFCSVSTFGITPGEIYEDGRRAFNLGHWEECHAKLSDLFEIWPENPMKDRALFMMTVSDIRRQHTSESERKKCLLASWTAALEKLRSAMPEDDLVELQTTIECHEPISATASSVTALGDIAPERLLHLIKRGVIFTPRAEPLKTLEWIYAWRRNHTNGAVGLLDGLLHLRVCKALWQFYLSPIAASENTAILEKLEFWPVNEALRKTLDSAFSAGDLDVKREAALLGVSFEYLDGKNHLISEKPSKWIRYLHERGIDKSEAWCP